MANEKTEIMNSRSLIYILAVLLVIAFKLINNNTVSETISAEMKSHEEIIALAE